LKLEITCGWQDILFKELEKNTILDVILNQNPLKVIGMDLVVIQTFLSKKQEKKEVLDLLLINV
jgi:hypothetical protein